MALTTYVCTNCGFWQRHFATPQHCPVCEDVRHTPPDDGYQFLRPDDLQTRRTVWIQMGPAIVMFYTEPSIGIGPCGYLIAHPEGNIFWESTGWYSADALDYIENRGGIRWLGASHPHAYGAAWQLQERFSPEVVIQRDDIPWTNMLRVSWPWDDHLALAPGVDLFHTGGHFDGHAVLYHAPTRALFAGDALKYHYDQQPFGISCHKGYNRQIPLSHAEIRRYREVIAPLDFSQVFTSFEHAPDVSTTDVLHLFDTRLTGRPSCAPLPLMRLHDASAAAR
jgi:hypothetical protein